MSGRPGPANGDRRALRLPRWLFLVLLVVALHGALWVAGALVTERLLAGLVPQAALERGGYPLAIVYRTPDLSVVTADGLSYAGRGVQAQVPVWHWTDVTLSARDVRIALPTGALTLPVAASGLEARLDFALPSGVPQVGDVVLAGVESPVLGLTVAGLHAAWNDGAGGNFTANLDGTRLRLPPGTPVGQAMERLFVLIIVHDINRLLGQGPAAWREAGGAADLRLEVTRWGDEVDLLLSGPLTLDDAGFPTGRLALSVTGWQRLLAVARELGVVDGTVSTMLGMGLAALSRPGPDGRPTLTTELALREGFITLLGQRLARVPSLFPAGAPGPSVP